MKEEDYSAPVDQIFSDLTSSEKGLSDFESQKRIKTFGLNEIAEQKRIPGIFKFLKQFNSPLIYILFLAMIISFIFNHLVDAYVILFIVLINATIGFFQERKAERAISSLKKMIVSYAKVLRDGELKKIPTEFLVPGDIILLEEGDKVPADARIIESKNLRTQEASLTGESFPVDKKAKTLPCSTNLSDRINMVFMGTIVVSGEARAIVTSTGKDTSIGQIANSIREVVQPKIHFQNKITELTLQMFLFAITGAGLTFLIGFFLNKLEFFEIFLFTIASLVSGIPEGLPAVIVIVLAVGANKMAKRNAVIRHLPSVETVGVVTVIATDKTGTLTENSMLAEKVLTVSDTYTITGKSWTPIGWFLKRNKKINPLSEPDLKKLLTISALCNKGSLLRTEKDYEIIGDPTEVSLLVLAKKAGLDKKSLSNIKILDDLSFNSELKLRATLVQEKNQKQIFSVGAFEEILHKSNYILQEGREHLIRSPVEKNKILEKAKNLAKQGYRVLAVAYKNSPSKIEEINSEMLNKMVFVGFVGMKDPPRKEVKESIQKAKKAGIRIIMKTGDHKETAIAIAKEIGLMEDDEEVLTEQELLTLSKEEFSEAVKRVNIFARVTPKTKLRIVEILQEQGEIVAMTGDGVNDAPALKRSDIGISMGVVGTDVARESSEMVLADDNFASIVNAVEEGRIIFQNIRQTSFFLITTNVAEDLTIISTLLLKLPLPLIPIQLLFLNLVTDTINDIPLAFEPGHHDLLSVPPKNRKEKIINFELLPFLIIVSGLMVLGTVLMFNHFLPQGIEKARTVAFVSMSLFQIFNVFNMRSLKKSLFKIGILSNKLSVISVCVSIALTLGVIYLSPLANIFGFVPLGLQTIILIFVITSLVFIFGELYKFLKY